jgi:hypothetical protein
MRRSLTRGSKIPGGKISPVPPGPAHTIEERQDVQTEIAEAGQAGGRKEWVAEDLRRLSAARLFG